MRPNYIHTYIHTQDVLYVMRTTSINTDNNTSEKRKTERDRSLYFYREGRTNGGRSYIRVHREKEENDDDDYSSHVVIRSCSSYYYYIDLF